MPLHEPSGGFDPIQLNGQLRPDLQAPLYDDFFYGNSGNSNFVQAWAALGAGAPDFNSANVANRPGVISINDGGLNSVTLLFQTGSIQPLANGFWQYVTDVNVPVLSDGTNNFFARVGVMNSAVAADPTDGIYFEYSNTVNAGDWTATCKGGGVQTQVDSGVQVTAGTFFRLKIQGADALAPVLFFVNNAQIASISTNIPVAQLGLGFQMKKNANTLLRNFGVDLVYFGFAFSSFR
jgi:hypothetical protein